MQNHQRPRAEWVEATKITVGKLTAVISITQGHRRMYSVQTGRLRDDGKFVNHIPVHTDGSFLVKVSPIADDLRELGTKVEEWIATDAAFRLDERIAREEKQASFGKKETRVTGKTARKKAKFSKQPTA